MEFYLVRHGESVSAAAGSRRPLTPTGRRDVERVARAAAARGVQVSQIFHSGILRAQQTAGVFSNILSPVNGMRELAGLRPDDDPLLAKAELETSTTAIMLIGHLPHMSRLAACLSFGVPDRTGVEFAPATIVCFSHENKLWKMLWQLTPTSLKADLTANRGWSTN
ncbi:MAG: phosphohistidine phosphatase SixA [Candidatus Binatia bacterium]